jgi:tetraacyldisaccharide 4'-kinase
MGCSRQSSLLLGATHWKLLARAGNYSLIKADHMKSSTFRDLVSGRRSDPPAHALRWMLRVAETPYTLAVGWRNRRYDLGRAAVHRVAVPVVSVGNLTLGGTGKTPFVKWIARWASQRGVRPAIVSRGYKAGNGQPNDEARELALALPDVPHVQDADRVAAARRALDEFAAELVILDDGFQHRRLGRDLDIVLLDALEPFGFDHVFPRGMLREPVSCLSRAHVVCLSRADLVSSSDRAAIHDRVAELAPQAGWCEVSHAPSGLVNSDGQTARLTLLTDRRIVAFCGLGNPAGFRRTLEDTGCEIVSWHEFPDHHKYSAADSHAIGELAASVRAELAICTHKDLVKLPQEKLGACPLWALTVDSKFLDGQEVLEERIAGAIRARLLD